MEYGPYAHRDRGADPKLPPLGVFFSEVAVKNEIASQAGATIYDKVVRLRVVIPGATKSQALYDILRTSPDGKEKIDNQVMARFRGVYEEWKEKRSPSESGTPLEQWPLMDVALVAALKDCNVFTVQALAGVSDGNLEHVRVPKAREWRAKAQAWLDEAGNAAAAVQLRAELAKRDDKIEALQKQVEALLAAQNGVKAPAFDKPRRKSSRTDDEAVAMAIDTGPEEARL